MAQNPASAAIPRIRSSNSLCQVRATTSDARGRPEPWAPGRGDLRDLFRGADGFERAWLGTRRQGCRGGLGASDSGSSAAAVTAPPSLPPGPGGRRPREAGASVSSGSSARGDPVQAPCSARVRWSPPGRGAVRVRASKTSLPTCSSQIATARGLSPHRLTPPTTPMPGPRPREPAGIVARGEPEAHRRGSERE